MPASADGTMRRFQPLFCVTYVCRLSNVNVCTFASSVFPRGDSVCSKAGCGGSLERNVVFEIIFFFFGGEGTFYQGLNERRVVCVCVCTYPPTLCFASHNLFYFYF